MKRNALIEALLAISQEASSSHQSSIQATQTDANLLLKLGVAGTTAAGTLAAAAGAAAFSAAASGTNAAQSAISEEVYQKQMAANINNLLAQEREKKLIEIRNSLAKKDVYEYSVQEGITDAEAYHELGSFYKGLEIVNEHLAESVVGNKKFTDDARGKLNLDEEIKSEKDSCKDDGKDVDLVACANLKKIEADKAAAQAKASADKAAADKANADIDKKAADVAKTEAENSQEEAEKLTKIKVDTDKANADAAKIKEETNKKYAEIAKIKAEAEADAKAKAKAKAKANETVK